MDPCPSCGSPVAQEPVCPGYRDSASGKWYQCYPACGNGILYECSQILCGWWFIDGMNPMNKLFDTNEERRPDWCKQGSIGA